MTDFATQLAATISDISSWADEDDLADALTLLTAKLAVILRDNGEANADRIAAEAVMIACIRDNIETEARQALRTR